MTCLQSLCQPARISFWYSTDCQKYISLTAENTFHRLPKTYSTDCRKYISLLKIYFTAENIFHWLLKIYFPAENISHCRKHISLTAENIFHCQKCSRRRFWDRQWSIVLQKQRCKIRTTKGEKKLSSIVMQTTVAYEMSQHERIWNIEILSDFKSKLKPRVKSPHPKGYCINAAERDKTVKTHHAEITGSKEKRNWRVGESRVGLDSERSRFVTGPSW